MAGLKVGQLCVSGFAHVVRPLVNSEGRENWGTLLWLTVVLMAEFWPEGRRRRRGRLNGVVRVVDAAEARRRRTRAGGGRGVSTVTGDFLADELRADSGNKAFRRSSIGSDGVCGLGSERERDAERVSMMELDGRATEIALLSAADRSSDDETLGLAVFELATDGFHLAAEEGGICDGRGRGSGDGVANGATWCWLPMARFGALVRALGDTVGLRGRGVLKDAVEASTFWPSGSGGGSGSGFPDPVVKSATAGTLFAAGRNASAPAACGLGDAATGRRDGAAGGTQSANRSMTGRDLAALGGGMERRLPDAVENSDGNLGGCALCGAAAAAAARVAGAAAGAHADGAPEAHTSDVGVAAANSARAVGG
ncbi:hypothetical protein FGB62_91g012 [Gracilaria domingensis]|nr:hypothetical protein FGB62_91g012 [Gracilaria domingensis]